MARFVTEDKLNSEIQTLFEEAKKELLIISPFIKLSDRLKDILKRRVADPELKVVLVFGKNESNKRRSLSNEDFSFFKQFANIKIYYEPRLHAKYYSNEKKAVLSSMNLLEYSQNNNIEFGIVIESTGATQLIGELISGDKLDEEAPKYFKGLIENRSPVYHNEPIFKKTMLGLSNKYSHSEVTKDSLTDQLSSTKAPKAAPVEKKKSVTPSKVVKSKLLTTNQLSQLTGLSSQKVNSWFTDNKLMYKKDKDWVITEKGKQIGGLEKSGQFGVFVAWPEVVAKRIVEL